MNWVIYEPIDGAPDRPLSVHNPAIQWSLFNVDMRDVVRAHVLTLNVPSSDKVNRFVLSSSVFTWKEAMVVALVCREVAPRLRPLCAAMAVRSRSCSHHHLCATCDTSRTEFCE
jgi:hypothetical protein